MNALFICSQNMLRSPTAEKTFADYPGVTTRSAGIDVDAVKPVTAEMVEWADIILVMENHHRRFIEENFATQLEGKKLVTLRIPDNYEFMDPDLVALLKERVPQYLMTN